MIAILKCLYSWLFRNAVSIRILGNKTDLEPLREVAARTASEYAETIGALLFETSALANVGIQDAFAAISRVT